MLQKIFGLDKSKTNVKTEIIAGLTTFLTMAYILAVNPNILSITGMDKGENIRHCQECCKTCNNLGLHIGFGFVQSENFLQHKLFIWVN